MFDFLSKLFHKEGSGVVAKERLKLVLIHDRNDISPETLDNIKTDIILTLKKYLEIDEGGIEVLLDKQDRSVALVANVPLKTMARPKAKRGQKKKDD